MHPESMGVASAFVPIVRRVIGDDLPFAVRFWDGSELGPSTPTATVVVRSPLALRRMLGAPGELGIGRAYVAGDLDLEGDWDAVLALGDRHPTFRFRAQDILALARVAVSTGAWRPIRVQRPSEEARLRGRLHSKERDAQAISHHYDVGNDFYGLVLGPRLVYSCAYFASPDASLESAQTDKMELICRKLRLRAGERMLDVGCGWGSLAIHAARHHGVSVVGVTLSKEQAELADKIGRASCRERV